MIKSIVNSLKIALILFAIFTGIILLSNYINYGTFLF